MRLSLVGTRGALVLALITVAVAGGATYALLQQEGVISACYTNSTGALRIINSAVTSCRPSETPLSWNQAGVAGPQGEVGPQGPPGDDGEPGQDGAPGPAADFVVGRVTLPTGCAGCTAFSFSPEGYTPPQDSQNPDAVALPIGLGATMSEVMFTLSSPPQGGGGFRVGFSDGTNFHFCDIAPGTSSCSPEGTSTFGGPVRGFIDTSYVENTGKHVSFSWKRTF